MNPSYIHLTLNHIPILGFGIGVGLFVISLLQKQKSQSELKRAGLVIFFLSAAFTVATYVSGNDAQQALKTTPGVSAPLMEAHETAALIAFIFMQVTGFFSWIGLWAWGRVSKFTRWNTGIVLVLAVITAILMSRAGYMGGAIRHPETDVAQNIHIDASVPTLARAWGMFVQEQSWVWPTCETLHFVGLSMLFGVVLTINLRMMGAGKSMVSFEALYQLLPVGMLGFTLNLVTGMMFFVAAPEQYTGKLFFLKMLLVVAGAINLLYFMLCAGPWRVENGEGASAWTKLMALSATAIWVVVLFCGHMLPWLGNSF